MSVTKGKGRDKRGKDNLIIGSLSPTPGPDIIYQSGKIYLKPLKSCLDSKSTLCYRRIKRQIGQISQQKIFFLQLVYELKRYVNLLVVNIQIPRDFF